MTAFIIIPCIALCLLATVITFVASKVNPLAGLHNMPKAIQERVRALPEYRYCMPPELSTGRRLLKKLPLFIVAIALLFIISRKLGAHDFLTGFVEVLVIWIVVKLWVAIVLDCAWLAHDRRRWIPGTEDMVTAYRDYAFWLSSIPRSIAAGIVAAAIVGLASHFVPIPF